MTGICFRPDICICKPESDNCCAGFVSNVSFDSLTRLCVGYMYVLGVEGNVEVKFWRRKHEVGGTEAGRVRLQVNDWLLQLSCLY